VQGSRRDPLDLAHPGRVFAIIAILILVVDQITKALVRSHFVQGQAIIILPHVLHLTYVHNEGAAFGLFPGGQPFFIATSLLVLAAIVGFWLKTRPREWPVVVALAMVTAGALGNLIDRAVIGQVTDFFEFAFIDFPVFNVADMGIVGGVGVLAAWILFAPAPETTAEQAEAVAPHDDEPPAIDTSGTEPLAGIESPDTTQEHV
jgi:signal peptidase II